MAENEGMEEKDLATEQKREFNEIILEQIEKLKNGESRIIIGEMEAQKFGDQAILNVRGKTIAIVRGNTIEYNLANFEELKKSLQEEGQTLDDLGLPDLQAEIDKIKKQTVEKENEPKEQGGEPQEPDDNGEEVNAEKDDEKPDLTDEKDSKKEEIAKQYNVNASQVIHIANDTKVAGDERFKGLVAWAKDYDDIYIIPGEDEYSHKFIGTRDGKQEEVDTRMTQRGGKTPSVTIKRTDGEKITEISNPLAMYEIDSNTSVAIIINEHGKQEALYCRQQEGNEKEYWGIVIPEASGKNVLQQEPEAREFIDSRHNSGLDLSEKAKALGRQEDLEERGLPSKQKGTQVKEIEGNNEQNRALNIEDIVDDLMKRDGIVDKATMPPGYYENKAKKVLALMEGNDSITYEQAVEQVENEGQRAPGGGREPGRRRGE